jgi:hypothetical protein
MAENKKIDNIEDKINDNVVYALYKENQLPLIGGINPENVEIGIAEYNEWKLCAMDEKDFNKYFEFKLYPIPKSIAVGLTIDIEKQEVIDNVTSDIPQDAEVENNEITEEQKELAKIARQYVDILELKYVTRAKVRRFKEFEDDLADTKLLLEFLLSYMIDDYMNKTEVEKNNFPLKEFMDEIVDEYKNLDLRIKNDKYIKKIPQIIKDEKLIYKIVKSNFIDPVKKMNNE